MLSNDGKTEIGTPLLKKARVVAEVLEHGRGSKIFVFKYKNKTRYRRRHGHRQDFTRLAIKQIVSEAGVVSKSEVRKRPRKLEVKVEPEEAPVTAPEATTEVAEAPPKPRRARTPRPKGEAEAAAETPAAETTEEAPAPKKPTRRKATPKAETEGE